MKNDFRELMMEKARKGEMINEDESSAMNDALGEYKDDKDILDKLKGQSVTVAAPDKESLKKGLEVAEDVIEDIPAEEMEESEETLESLMSELEVLKAKIEAKMAEEETEEMPEMEDSEEIVEEY